MAALHAKPVPVDTVASAARAALEEARGNVQDAARIFERRVRADLDLRVALTEPLLAGASYDAVRAASRGDRKRAWAAPVERLVATRVSGAHRVVQLAAGTLLMFPLPGGKKLGEATREEIATAAGFYDEQASDMSAKARWLRLVAQSLPGDRRAGEVLNEKRLRELQAEAHRG
jgi:hypothetical protein